MIVDYVRMVKDEHEQQLMREASLANDKIMEELIPLVVKRIHRKRTERKSSRNVCGYRSFRSFL